MRPRFVLDIRLDAFELFNEVFGGFLRIPGGVDKADGVREFMVAEEKMQRFVPRASTYRAHKYPDGKGAGAISECARTASSVAIQRMPASENKRAASSETDPSDGHMPCGARPKRAM